MTVSIPDKSYFRIGEVSRLLGVQPYVIRYWETEFKTVKPIRTRSDQRLYRHKDVEELLMIRKLLYERISPSTGPAAHKLREEPIQPARTGRRARMRSKRDCAIRKSSVNRLLNAPISNASLISAHQKDNHTDRNRTFPSVWRHPDPPRYFLFPFGCLQPFLLSCLTSILKMGCRRTFSARISRPDPIGTAVLAGRAVTPASIALFNNDMAASP